MNNATENEEKIMSNENPFPKKYLRPEASSLHWDRIYDSQLKALIKILAILEESIGNLEIVTASNKQKGCQRPIPSWFDLYRENRIALLDGARGTGKTSLMLTLIQSFELKENHFQPPYETRECKCNSGSDSKPEPENPKGNANQACKPKETKTVEEIKKEEENKKEKRKRKADEEYQRKSQIKQKLDQLKHRIIWLEPLDMEPLPGPANLLASVLARIENAVKPYFQTATKSDKHRDPRGILELCPDYLDGLQKLHRLQADVALSWEGNIAQRGAHIDPDAYSSEVNRTENARLVLNRELSDVLNQLAGNIPLACGITDPIFVLPVDDLDLNPVRCLEVLRLLRMVNVPRLFILVLGDLNIIEIVLSLKHSGELISAAGKYSSRISEDEYISIRKQANSVAYNVMRKLLPPGQRIKIEPMQVWDALNYKPLSPNSTSLTALHQLLDKVTISLDAISQGGNPKMSNGKEVKTLWDFLFYPFPYPDGDILEEDLKPCAYRARMVLRVPPRHIADWWSLLQSEENDYSSSYKNENKEKVREAKFLDNLGRLCRSAIGEDTSISHENRQKYRDALRKSKLTNEWELFLGITTIPETGPIEKIPLPLAGDSPAIQRKFHVCCSNGWRLYPEESELFRQIDYFPIVDTYMLKEEIDRFSKGQFSFSEETAAALLLFHDLHALGTREKVSRTKINIYRPIQIWAKTTWQYGKLSESILWPIPEFLSSWGYDIFLRYWDIAIENFMKLPKNDRQIFLVYSWIDSAVTVLLRGDHLLCSEDVIDQNKDSKNWDGVGKKLACRINELCSNISNEENKEDPRKNLIEKWLKLVINLLMPEVSGIEKNYVKCFLDNITPNDFWVKAKIDIEQYRKEIFDNLKKMEMDDDKTITELTEELKEDGDGYLNALLNNGN
jgi:hypothetical protein